MGKSDANKSYDTIKIREAKMNKNVFSIDLGRLYI